MLMSDSHKNSAFRHTRCTRHHITPLPRCGHVRSTHSTSSDMRVPRPSSTLRFIGPMARAVKYAWGVLRGSLRHGEAFFSAAPSAASLAPAFLQQQAARWASTFNGCGQLQSLCTSKVKPYCQAATLAHVGACCMGPCLVVQGGRTGRCIQGEASVPIIFCDANCQHTQPADQHGIQARPGWVILVAGER